MGSGLEALIVSAVGLALGGGLVWGIYRARFGSFRNRLQALEHRAEREQQQKLAELELESKARVLESEREHEAKGRQRAAEVEEALRGIESERAQLNEEREALQQREAVLDQRSAALDRAEQRQRDADERLTVDLKRAEEELQRVAALSRQDAQEELVASITSAARKEAGRRIAELERDAERTASERAALLIATAAHRMAASFVAEKTVTVVQLPTDDLKGRIIGREGRNIRALETATGVDVIVDDTPEVVVLSGFSPFRREVARVALERLVEDGRIHPARIDEVVASVRDELESSVLEEGERIALELGAGTFAPPLLKAVGQLRFHTMSGQSLRAHAEETVAVAGAMAAELKVDGALARRVALLYVLGEVADHTLAGTAAEAAVEFARRNGEKRPILSALSSLAEGRPDTVVAVVVESAARLSRGRPGARRERLEDYVKRHEAMEAISRSFDGVEEAFAVQAGREIRVMVRFSEVDDDGSLLLARDISKALEEELTLPGEVKVTVVREGRATELAR